MKLNCIGAPIFTLIFLLLNLHATAQDSRDLWIKTSKEAVSSTIPTESKVMPSKAYYYQLDLDGLKAQLRNAPDRKDFRGESNTVISFPNGNGGLDRYEVFEASIMHPELQAKYPDLRSYVGQSMDNPATMIRFSVTPRGLHSMILSAGEGAQFIDPYDKDNNFYLVYYKRHLPNLKDSFICDVHDDISSSSSSSASRNANDGILRDFRLALASTVEYSTFHYESAGFIASDPAADRKAAVLAAMVVTMTRVNGIYEKDLSVTMTLISNNDDIIFVDDPDPYNNTNGSVMLGQNQSELDTTIGAANYDIGHVFSTGGGGIAFLGFVCVDGQKAKGVTGLSSPIGDVFDVDFVAHEIGHQFGANHTFNGDAGNCAGGNRNESTSYEPGSGSTIMAYAGICFPQDVQSNSDAYFHQASIAEMWSYITTGSGTCASPQTATGNSAPTALAGNDYTIPISTPYKLTGSSTDADGTGSHTFTWEQYDLGLGASGVPTESTATGPLVRSFEGTSDPVRYIPQLDSVLVNGGTSTTWEKLVNVSRTINFELTVRDNGVAGGQTDSDGMVVTTNDGAGPFTVTSQSSTGIVWVPSASETITWDVANTDVAPVSTSNVNILLSTDGGVNFDTVLIANTPNDGTEDITVPNIPSSNCRIMVEAVGNIFFAVNSEPFSLGLSTICTQYASAENLNLPIEDGTGANTPGNPLFDFINIPDSETIDYIRVNADVSHTYIQDLVIQIQHPDGSTFTNVWNRGCEGENDLDVIFEDGAPAIVCAEPTTGTYSPSSPLNVFNGLNSAGNWAIAIVDYFNDDTGTLNDWYIEVCVTTTLGMDEVLDIADLNVFPNPNSGEFTVKLRSNSGERIELSVYDIRGRSVFAANYENAVNFRKDISLNSLQSGLYLLKVSDGRSSSIKKIIIE